MDYFKRTIQRDFRPPVFFSHNLNLPGPMTNGLKYFRVWNSQPYSKNTLANVKPELSSVDIVPLKDLFLPFAKLTCLETLSIF